jgi:hypothetical protein
MAAKKKTKGLSPKAPAAGGGGVLAGLVAVWLGVDVETALVIIAGVGALIGAIIAPPGNVVTERQSKNRTPIKLEERGYALVELLVAVILLVLLIWLVAAVVH